MSHRMIGIIVGVAGGVVFPVMAGAALQYSQTMIAIGFIVSAIVAIATGLLAYLSAPHKGGTFKHIDIDSKIITEKRYDGIPPAFIGVFMAGILTMYAGMLFLPSGPAPYKLSDFTTFGLFCFASLLILVVGTVYLHVYLTQVDKIYNKTINRSLGHHTMNHLG